MINTELLAMCQKGLTRDEASSLKMYKCSAGKLTIGIGRNIEDNGISSDEEALMFMNDLNACYTDLSKTPWFPTLDIPRQYAFLNMRFNLGMPRFLGFKKMLAAVCSRDWKTAAAEAKDSKWYKDVGVRAERLCKVIETGVYQ